MEKLKTTFKQSPLLTILSVVFSVYIASLMFLAVIVAVEPQSKIGNIVDNLF